MRHLKRLPAPQILTDKKEEWTHRFLQSNKPRPDSSKYAHDEIRSTLNAMSFHKCFYCERKLKGIPQEVDHYVEVAEAREKAFEWENLCLACSDCNKKLPNRSIPNQATLDPFVYTDEEIMEHITFEDEIIMINQASAVGAQTIRKYKLDSETLDLLRGKYLKEFHKELIKILESRIREKRSHLNAQEKSALRRFAQIDHPFSLMFKILLAKYPQIEL
jgi:5-methylcytosine-specific restriction endonuclease McrA